MPSQTTSETDQTAGVISAAPWRVKALSVLPGYRLAVIFMDDISGIADFSSVLTAGECGMFEALKDNSCFNQARLALGVVTWPNGADIDPAWMYEQIKLNKSWSVPF